MTELLKVCDHMSPTLISFTPEMNIHEAIEALLEHRISGAPVLNAEGSLVGILTKRDCMRISFTASYHREWGGPVSDYMSTEVETIDADEDIVTVAGMFLESRFRRYPVMRDDRVVGVISRHDVLGALRQLW